MIVSVEPVGTLSYGEAEPFVLVRTGCGVRCVLGGKAGSCLGSLDGVPWSCSRRDWGAREGSRAMV